MSLTGRLTGEYFLKTVESYTKIYKSIENSVSKIFTSVIHFSCKVKFKSNCELCVNVQLITSQEERKEKCACDSNAFIY